MSFWLCSQLLQTLNPAPFSCQQQMWQLPYGTWRRVAEFSRSDDMFKTCQILQAKSNLVCLLRRHGEFLTQKKKKKKKCCTWLGFALCAQAGRPNFVTQLHSPSSNSSLLQLVEDSVIKCNFLHETWVHVFLVYLFLGICESCLRLTKTSSVCLQTNRLHVAVCLLAFVLFVSISRTPN